MIGKDSDKIQVVLKKKEIDIIKEMAQDDDRSVSYIAAKLIRKVLGSKK